MSSSTDRIREALEVYPEMHGFPRYEYEECAIVEDAARSFVEGELPPDFPSEADVEAAANYLVAHESYVTVSVHSAERLAKTLLKVVAESRRAAHLLPGDDE